MPREIPGSVDIPEREFVFVELRERESFRTLVDGTLGGGLRVPLPKAGGIMEEKAVVLLGDGPQLLGMSYKGDLLGWRDRIAEFCRETSRRWGIAAGGVLTMSDGRRSSLEEAKIVFLE